ncbi:MAG: DUF2249 domain-containing protein [Pseudomonadota bacterium]|nr:DUF2249 domain-containing protein [Pseudomonadota bacterium]MDP1903323.1 DUF2249 domain-containing protein [Pseudomonadota bacterium]MDP2352535.1 DUF2249 domain-containing protein [Pseudomonadota bacterium]
MKQDVLVDGRWLMPPEPMEKVLLALDQLRPGQRVRFLLHREPHPLYGILENMGYRHQTHLLPDGCYEILIEARGACR